MEKENLLFDFIVKNNIATKGEVTLVTNLNGYTCKTLWSIITARTGLRNVWQLAAEGYNTKEIENL